MPKYTYRRHCEIKFAAAKGSSRPRRGRERKLAEAFQVLERDTNSQDARVKQQKEKRITSRSLRIGISFPTQINVQSYITVCTTKKRDRPLWAPRFFPRLCFLFSKI